MNWLHSLLLLWKLKYWPPARNNTNQLSGKYIMNTAELDSYSLDDAVKFNQDLNPRLWHQQRMRPDVREKLLEIAADFKQSLGLSDLEVKDITVSGSNAGFTYTPHSDIDLHLVVDIPQADVSDVYRELFDAKKYQYNAEHNITIGGYDVELYVENANQPPVSQGVYSVVQDDWINIPKRRRSTVDDDAVRSKYADIKHRIQVAIDSRDHEQISAMAAKIKKMRTAGLAQSGEMGPENLAYKMLRTQGLIKQLYDARTTARDLELSLNERRKKKKQVRYAYGGYWAPGFSFGDGDGGGGGESIQEVSVTPDGVSPSTKMFLEQDSVKDTDILKSFAQYVSSELDLAKMPRIIVKRRPEWAEQNGSFGQYVPELNELTLSLHGRHIVDVLRTLAHELTHAHQQQTTGIPDNGGDTGSEFENQANARAGEFMRHFADAHPEYFAQPGLQESSGYIPTAKEKNDPRFVMALSVDVQPGATGKNANRMSLKTDAQGRPQQARTNGLVESLAREFEQFDETTTLFEIKMTGKNLRAEAAKTGAQAGMEFEMIVPNVESDVEPEYEPDMDQDQRARSFSDVRDFFHDGDYNGRRAVDDLMDELSNEYEEWIQEQTAEQWDRDGVDYMRDFIEINNDLFDRDEAMVQARDEVVAANPDLSPESEDFQQLVSARLDELQEQFVLTAFEDRGRIYNDAFETFADEQRYEYDERSFLDDRYQTMSDIQSNFDISWPHYYDINDGQSGDMEIDQIADEFGSYMGKPVNASSSYHGARREAGHYVVEPDGSLEGDNPGDGGLEFVSPPMPIDEMISDLNKVKAWAGRTGCYTNDSTGLHINISVPDYSINKLDYVKLAILMGDEYILDLFGRSGNTYAKSAMGKIKSALKQKPEAAAQIMDLMKQGLDGAATKAIHTGITDKYTSINTKTGYIEFRSPGGDWLDSNFDKIENTLLRFTVALSAAINPEAYRKEYLTKLYKLLSEGMADKSDVNIIQLFSNYSAGELDKPALIRQVRAKQLARNVAKGKTTGKMWWDVSRPGYMSSIEVVASSKEEAIDVALQPGNYPDWASARNTLQAKPLRPYEAPTQTPNVPQGSSTGTWGVWVPSLDRFATIANAGPRRFESEADAQAWIQDYNTRNSGNDIGLVAREVAAAQPQEYEVFDRDTGATVDTFTASNDQEVAIRLNDYRTMGPHNLTPEQAQQRYGLRRAGSTPIARQPEFQEPSAARGDLTPRGPGPWEIYRISDNSSVRNLTHTDRQMAGQEARMALGMRGEAPELYGVRTRQAAGSAPRSEYELFLKSNGQVVTAPSGNPIIFSATDPDDAANKIARYVADFNLPGHPTNYDVRSVQPPGQSDAAQGGLVDVAGEQPAAASQAPQQWTGAWLVLNSEGRVLQRFTGIGNVQADANRHAMNWLRSNPRHMQAGVTVAPEMA
jgi:hypothetical protein